MKRSLFFSPRRISPGLNGLLLLGGLLMASQAQAELCMSDDSAGLNTCRNNRRPQTPDWGSHNVVTDTTPTGAGGGRLDYRYRYEFCKNNQYCQRWVLEVGPPRRYVEDTGCVFKIVQDKVLEAQSQCTLDNFNIRKRAEQCQAYVSSQSYSPFSGGTLPAGTTGAVLRFMQPGNPNGGMWGSCGSDLTMVTETHDDYEPDGARNLDMGIGRWATVTVPNYNGTSVELQKVNNMGPFRAAMSQLMRANGDSHNLVWDEMYSKAGDWRVFARNDPSALNHQIVAPYTLAGAPPAITHTACYNNRASAFVQGFSNPAGGGATATPANVDVTTGNQAPPNPNIVQQLVADLRTVSKALSSFRSVHYCTEAQTRWSQACSAMAPTYAHSMGAIVTRVNGLHTNLNIGSVDNMWGGPSYRNNCDLVPWVVQVGIRFLLSQVPSTDGKNYVICTQPHQVDCLRDGRWISSPGGAGPRTVECNNPSDPAYPYACEKWWCAGQPGSPATQIYSGRDNFPGHVDDPADSGNAPDHWEFCPNEASYKGRVQACIDQYLAGTSDETDLWTCFKSAIQLAIGAWGSGPDHLLGGKGGAIDYNGYQVLSGLDNLGRPYGVGFRGAYLQNPPPSYPPKPVWCGDGVCEAGQETTASCPSDCFNPCGMGGCDAGPVSYCGNAVCDSGETYTSCPSDCFNPCGMGGCDGGS